MIFKPFFRRIAEENGEIPDIWIYDELPQNVKAQIWMIFEQVDNNNYPAGELSKAICLYLQKEIGVFQLSDGSIHSIYSDWSYPNELRNFFFNEYNKKNDKQLHFRYCLTVLELIMKILLNKVESKEYIQNRKIYKEAIEEINYRLREARIGWAFNTDAELLIRIDTEATYQLAIEPAFHLLSDAKFSESVKDFAKAFEYYQVGTPKDLESAIASAVKALESTIRNICVIKNYNFDKNTTLQPLINVLIQNKYLPTYQDSFMNALGNIFVASGTIGNNIARHGKEEAKAKNTMAILNDKLVEFVLAQAASTIVFLVSNLKE
jgi:hypothetical protein